MNNGDVVTKSRGVLNIHYTQYCVYKIDIEIYSSAFMFRSGSNIYFHDRRGIICLNINYMSGHLIKKQLLQIIFNELINKTSSEHQLNDQSKWFYKFHRDFSNTLLCRN